ncbi:MAG TPA: hypothetical protein VHJ40_07035 [Actinomycetota bacterium]|nr:hypothetical protein [Actinomycetota bacterium]
MKRKEAAVARQTPTDKIRRWAKNFEVPSSRSGLSKARKRVKKMEMPGSKGLSKATKRIKEMEMPRPKGLSRAKVKADVKSPKEIKREIKMHRALAAAEAKAKARPKKRRRGLKKRLFRFGVVSSLGAGLMYLFDPEHGKARRAEMSKKVDEALSPNLNKDKPSKPS